MLTQFSGNARKVIVSAAGVAAFNSRWPCSELRDSRSYWFEFDDSGDLIDSDVPEHDDGSAANAMAEDCRVWLFQDENPEWAPDNDSPLYIGGDRPEIEIPARGLDSDDDRVQRVRDAVLAALDATAAAIYGEGVLGATDSELPELFKALDAQAGRMLERAAAVIREREEKRNQAFRACPILCAYISTALEDLQHSEADEACSDGREARDSGTVYTLPDAEFEKAKQDCERFASEMAADIAAAQELVPGEEGLRYANGRYMTADRIGSTFYLQRVGHGVGFEDDGDAEPLKRLAFYARSHSAESPYFGDDGRVYGF